MGDWLPGAAGRGPWGAAAHGAGGDGNVLELLGKSGGRTRAKRHRIAPLKMVNFVM